MNKKFLPFVALGLFNFLTVVLHAQGLVVFPQGNAAWSVDITPQTSGGSGSSASSHSAYATHVEVTQLDKLKRIVITWSDGGNSEKWTVTGLPVTFNEDPKSGLVRPRQNGSSMEAITNLSLTYDSFAFAWIAPGCLREKRPVTYQQKQCFHYGGQIALPFPGIPVYTKREAWIDAKTLLPVALDNGDSLSLFKFQTKPPTGTLIPPPAFQKEIVYYKAVMGYP